MRSFEQCFWKADSVSLIALDSYRVDDDDNWIESRILTNHAPYTN